MPLWSFSSSSSRMKGSASTSSPADFARRHLDGFGVLLQYCLHDGVLSRQYCLPRRRTANFLCCCKFSCRVILVASLRLFCCNESSQCAVVQKLKLELLRLQPSCVQGVQRLCLAVKQLASGLLKTLASKPERACIRLSTVQFANGPKRSMGHFLGGKKSIFLIRVRRTTPPWRPPAESCQFVA